MENEDITEKYFPCSDGEQTSDSGYKKSEDDTTRKEDSVPVCQRSSPIINVSSTTPSLMKKIPKKMLHLTPEEAEERRIKNNSNERLRTHGIVDALKELGQALPSYLTQQKKWTKKFILSTTIDYITTLEELLACDDENQSDGYRFLQGLRIAKEQMGPEWFVKRSDEDIYKSPKDFNSCYEFRGVNEKQTFSSSSDLETLPLPKDIHQDEASFPATPRLARSTSYTDDVQHNYHPFDLKLHPQFVLKGSQQHQQNPYQQFTFQSTSHFLATTSHSSEQLHHKNSSSSPCEQWIPELDLSIEDEEKPFTKRSFEDSEADKSYKKRRHTMESGFEDSSPNRSTDVHSFPSCQFQSRIESPIPTKTNTLCSEAADTRPGILDPISFENFHKHRRRQVPNNLTTMHRYRSFNTQTSSSPQHIKQYPSITPVKSSSHTTSRVMDYSKKKNHVQMSEHEANYYDNQIFQGNNNSYNNNNNNNNCSTPKSMSSTASHFLPFCGPSPIRPSHILPQECSYSQRKDVHNKSSASESNSINESYIQANLRGRDYSSINNSSDSTTRHAMACNSSSIYRNIGIKGGNLSQSIKNDYAWDSINSSPMLECAVLLNPDSDVQSDCRPNNEKVCNEDTDSGINLCTLIE